MKQDLQRIYMQLRYWGLVENQYDFSKRWLGQCSSYYSSIKTRGLEPNAEAVLALLVRLRNHNDYLQQTDAPRTNRRMGQLSSMLEQEAECISTQLFDDGLRRVAQRQTVEIGA